MQIITIIDVIYRYELYVVYNADESSIPNEGACQSVSALFASEVRRIGPWLGGSVEPKGPRH